MAKRIDKAGEVVALQALLTNEATVLGYDGKTGIGAADIGDQITANQAGGRCAVSHGGSQRVQ